MISRAHPRALLWFFLSGPAFALFLSAQQPPPEDYRYRVDVQLVMVSASVTAPDGTPVTWLEQDAFEVYEDGVARPLKVFEKKTAIPLQLVLLVDASLSTASELPAEKMAVARFLQRVLRPVDAAALYEFSGKSRALVDFSDNPKKLEAGLQLIRPRAGTALYDTLIEAAAQLQRREGRRVLVLITDGNDTTSECDYHAALRALQEAEATVFALIVRPIPGESGRNVRGEHVLVNLADMTGGRVFYPARMAELDRFFDELGALLRTQYLLGYQAAPPEWRERLRTIEVRVRGTDYVVRHRKSYYAEARR
ncbi:MAG: VWA domain-containing protein [Acidobacteria bacterium]|nr:VWA domain-containing protein [Acidobacteriota bacterium]